MLNTYHPKPYWSEVANRIQSRDGYNVIAGDDEPYYRRKREKFMRLLSGIPIENKDVAEIGCGPGGNLVFVHNFKPKTLTGIDISADMLAHAKKHIPADITLIHSSGENMPVDDLFFDITFTATVLQHNTDDDMWSRVIKDLCRVTREEVHIFERISTSVQGDHLCKGRPVKDYVAAFEEQGFTLAHEQYIYMYLGHLISGAIRKGLNPANRKEGEPLNRISIFLQNMLLPITDMLDNLGKLKGDLGHLAFVRKK